MEVALPFPVTGTSGTSPPYVWSDSMGLDEHLLS